MRLTWRDGVAAAFAGLIALVVLAVSGSWGWPLLGSYTAGIVALVLLAVPMCVVGGYAFWDSVAFEHPVLANLVNAAELRALPAGERAAAIHRIAGSLRSIAVASARYRCSNCGYSTQRFIWHCPSCKLWETVRPIQSVPLENVLG